MAKVIPLADARAVARQPPTLSPRSRERRVRPARDAARSRGHARTPLHDLRISVTDRCNFRCVYCMPKDVFGRDYPFLPHAELLTFEEITRVAQRVRRPRRRRSSG